jgi:hypothetical protein
LPGVFSLTGEGDEPIKQKDMSSINPFSGYLAQGSQVERTQAAEKSRQIRRSQQLAKNIAQQDDNLEHQVESPDTVSGASGEQKPKDEKKQRKGQGKGRKDDDGQPHVDIKA